MGGFLAANAFLLAIILIGAGLFYVIGNGVQALGLPPDYEIYAWCVAILATVVGAYYASRWLHGRIQRYLNKRQGGRHA